MGRSRALLERHELIPILVHLRLGGYPARPPPAPVLETPRVTYGAVGRKRPQPSRAQLQPPRQAPEPWG